MIRQWFPLKPGCKIIPDLMYPLELIVAREPPQPFANCLSHGSRHAFSGYGGKFLGEPMSLFVLDIQAHGAILP